MSNVLELRDTDSCNLQVASSASSGAEQVAWCHIWWGKTANSTTEVLAFLPKLASTSRDNSCPHQLPKASVHDES